MKGRDRERTKRGRSSIHSFITGKNTETQAKQRERSSILLVHSPNAHNSNPGLTWVTGRQVSESSPAASQDASK